jgi:hypothetical protein
LLLLLCCTIFSWMSVFWPLLLGAPNSTIIVDQ